MPAWEVVVFRDLVETQTRVDTWHREFGRVDCAAFQRWEDVRCAKQRGRNAQLLHRFCTQTKETHVQAFEILNSVDLFFEPARGFRRDHAARGGHNVIAVVVIHLLPVFRAIIIENPAHELARFGTKRHGCKQRRRVDFTLPVARGCIGCIHRSVGNRVQRFERWDQLAGIIMFKLDIAGDRVDLGYKIHSCSAKDRQVLTKGRRHFDDVLRLCGAADHRDARNGC